MVDEDDEQLDDLLSDTDEESHETGTEESEYDPTSGDAVRARKAEREKKRALELLDEKEKELESLRHSRIPNVPSVNEPSSAEKKYTETEIHQMYSDDQIGATEAERLLKDVEERKEVEREERIIQRIANQTKGQEALNGMKNELEMYMKNIPTLNDKASDDFNDVKNEYTKLVNMGSPNNAVTELLAVKSVFGSLDRVKGISSQNIDQFDRDNRDTSMESSGGTRPSDKGRSTSKDRDILRRVPSDYQEYWDSRGYTNEYKLKLAKAMTPSKLIKR